MLDRYKFRAKNARNNYWVHGVYFKHQKRTPAAFGDEITEDDYDHLIIRDGFSDWTRLKPIEFVVILPDTVGQCTGLKDSNGTLIYEGDIVEHNHRIYKVILTDDEVASCGCCYAGFTGCGFVMETKDGYRGDLYNGSCEVVGNIHDNPELLGEQS